MAIKIIKDDYFKKFGVEPDWKDSETLAKFVTPRGKILPAMKSRLTAKNQRRLSKQIKYARYMALLPYTSYQTEKLRQSTRK